MSIIEIEYEKDFEDENNNLNTISGLPETVEQKGFSDILIKKELSPYESIKSFARLEEEHNANNESITFHSSMLLFFWPHQLWIIFIMKLIYNYHHDIGLTCMPYVVMTGFMWVGTLVISENASMQFKWVKKLLMKNKKFRQTEQAYEALKISLVNALKKEEFKHQYLAHLQLYKNHYDKVILELSEKKEVHFNTIAYLKNSIDELNRYQVNLIKAFSQNNMAESIFSLKKIEEKIINTNEYLDKTKEHTAKDEQFLVNYQKYLEKVDLTHLINPQSEKEKLKNNSTEEEMKKQINQKL
jgi:hypothetical protein